LAAISCCVLFQDEEGHVRGGLVEEETVLLKWFKTFQTQPPIKFSCQLCVAMKFSPLHSFSNGAISLGLSVRPQSKFPACTGFITSYDFGLLQCRTEKQ
jgi:hypothetical protein